MGWRQGGGPPLTLQESAQVIGHYRWVEMRLFEILGGWVPEVPELPAKLMLAVHAPHHAWHSSLWRDCLPELASVDRDGLTVAANSDLVACMDAVQGSERTIEKLAGVYRVVLPRLIASYAGHLDRASAVAEGPAIRALKLVLADDLDDWKEGEAVLQSMLIDELAVRRAAEHQAALEGRLVRAGGIAGHAAGVSGKAPDA
jgi:hypothetical protein